MKEKKINWEKKFKELQMEFDEYKMTQGTKQIEYFMEALEELWNKLRTSQNRRRTK